MRSDIEQGIAFAFSDLLPSPAVEEAVRAGLGTQRPRASRPPAAMWLLPAAAVLALGVALALRGGAGPRLADGGEEAPVLPAVVRPPKGVVSGGDGWRVRLSKDGRILVPVQASEAGQPPEWRQVNLNELAKHLDAAAMVFNEREAGAGRSGYETTPTGAKASRLRIDLLVDRDTPWRHVQWLLFICAEQRMPRVAFAVRDSRAEEERPINLDASLPTDLGLPRKPHVKVGVLIRAGEPVRYVVGNQEFEELASVARYLVDARDAGAAAGAPLRGEIKAGARIRFAEVVKLLAEFRQAGYDHVDFYGTDVPGADVRNAEALPTPDTDWKTREEPVDPGDEPPTPPVDER